MACNVLKSFFFEQQAQGVQKVRLVVGNEDSRRGGAGGVHLTSRVQCACRSLIACFRPVFGALSAATVRFRTTCIRFRRVFQARGNCDRQAIISSRVAPRDIGWHGTTGEPGNLRPAIVTIHHIPRYTF